MRLRSGGQAAAYQVGDWTDAEAEPLPRLRLPSTRADPDDSDRGMPLLSPGDPRIDPRVCAAFEADSEQSRAVRGLRSSLLGPRADGLQLRSLAILGVDAPAAGALTAANLGVVCAQAGYSTLLVDANTGAPTLHRLFRLPNEPGVTSIMTGRASWRDVAQATAVADLLIVPAGPAVTNAVDLFERTSLLGSLGGLVDGCDYVIIDGSSLGPVEAQLVCKDVDGVLLTVQQNRSGMRDLERLVLRLQEAEVPVIGTVYTV